MLGLLILAGSALKAQTWVPKIATDLALGYPFAVNPLDENVIYAAAGHSYLYRSRDRGKDWEKISAPVFAVGAIKAIAISPRDTNIFIVGLEILPGADRILRSTNGGVSWSTTWTGTFNYFGKPFDFRPEHPDTLYTMGNDTLYRSVDFASTWSVVRTVHGLFDLWCDVEIRPDSVNTLFVGDNSSGIWKSTDGGMSWTLVYSTTGEIPSIAIDPHRPAHMVAAKYGGGGGLVESNDGGANWHVLATPIGSANAWWVTFSRRDSGYIYFGSYGVTPSGPFLSRDNGATWSRYSRATSPKDSINGFNYAILAIDSLSVLALQADGIYLLEYLPGISITAPMRNDYWKSGTSHEIQWQDSNIVSVSLEYSTDDGASWAGIVAGLPGKSAHYLWTAPPMFSRSCRVRISDAAVPPSVMVSDSFAIFDTAFVMTTPSGGEAWQAGTTHRLHWRAGVSVAAELEYSLDGGNSWTLIAGISRGIEQYDWLVPDTVSSDCRVRIHVASDTTLNSQFSGAISILQCDPVVVTVSTLSGWNLISVPAKVQDASVSVLFPLATTPAYSFASGYHSVSVLEPGKGYWIKSGHVEITGCPIVAETLHVVQGWNMVGSLSDSVMVSNITTAPSGLQLSPFYRFNGGYQADSIIVPGNGYWVKAGSDGLIIAGKPQFGLSHKSPGKSHIEPQGRFR